MSFIFLIPSIFFILLLIGECYLPTMPQQTVYHRWDWILNAIGLFMQGLVIPVSAYLIATHLLAHLWPASKGILPFNWMGAFLLNFVGVDFLYYWQHRFFHGVPFAWKWHRCHHSTSRVDIWATARNSILTNFIFVYMLINPLLGFLCENPEGFFTGAMITASLDIMRHTRIDFKQVTLLKHLESVLGLIFILPKSHHRHHDAIAKPANFGANLSLWDRMFNTYSEYHSIVEYQPLYTPHPINQLLYPLQKELF